MDLARVGLCPTDAPRPSSFAPRRRSAGTRRVPARRPARALASCALLGALAAPAGAASVPDPWTDPGPPASLGGGDGGSSGAPDDEPYTPAVPATSPAMVDESSPWIVPLSIREALTAPGNGTDRRPGTAVLGLPFAPGRVPEQDGRPALSAVGAERFQWSTLERWPDGTVRWALLAAQVDLPSGTTTSGLAVGVGTGRSPQPDLAQVIDDAIRLRTGAMTLVVGTAPFAPFAELVVDGVPLAEAPDDPGLAGSDEDGAPLRPGPDTTVTIEENGPVRAVVRADGDLVDPSGEGVVGFTLRLSVCSGSRDLGIVLTLRNDDPERPRHVRLGSLGLSIPLEVGDEPIARLAGSDDVGGSPAQVEVTVPLQPASTASLYMARTTAPTDGVFSDPVTGDVSPPYAPHARWSWVTLADGEEVKRIEDHGYRIAVDGWTLPGHDLGDPDRYPAQPYVDLGGSAGGATAALRDMPFLWPASLQAHGDGRLVLGFHPAENQAPFTFVWQQHESREALVSFHGPGEVPPAAREAVSRRVDQPVTGRAADYLHYDRSGALPYRLVSIAEEKVVLLDLGLDTSVAPPAPERRVTRHYVSKTTGGYNNYARAEDWLGALWLRHGYPTAYHAGLDLATYRAEWAVPRSSGWVHDPSLTATNDGDVETSWGQVFDEEHRYLDGIILAWHLTGDPRLRDALADEAEVLADVTVWPHERSTYQSVRGVALASELTGDPVLLDPSQPGSLPARIETFANEIVDLDDPADWGWEAPPDAGARRLYANSSDNFDEKVEGETYVARGFISASLGPIALYHAHRVLEAAGHPAADLARGRLRDLAWWTRNELLGFDASGDWRLAYSYGINLETTFVWETVDFHPVLLGMAEAWKDTGDWGYLDTGVRQLWEAGDKGELAAFLTRLDCQHFMRTYMDAVGLSGSPGGVTSTPVEPGGDGSDEAPGSGAGEGRGTGGGTGPAAGSGAAASRGTAADAVSS